MESFKKMDEMAVELLERLPKIMQGSTDYGFDLFDRWIEYQLFQKYTLLNIL